MKSAHKRNCIIHFLKREDNSDCMSGKKDAVRVGKRKGQKYILNDTLSNLHKKFNQEIPEDAVSRSFFFKSRPKNIIPVIYAKHKVCLCQKHQNFALKLAALRLDGFVQNPDKFAKDTTTEAAEEKLKQIQRYEITYRVWKQVERPYKGTIIKKTTLTEERKTKDESVEEFITTMMSFKEHAARVTEQYTNISLLKEILMPNEVTVQLDFAENYVCNFSAEVSSAYYSKQQTIHAAVINYKEAPLTNLQHKSVVLLSDENDHTAPTVFAFLKKLIAWIRDNFKDVTSIHYISDSPTSQYRNCSIFKILSVHKQMFGIDATWQYLALLKEVRIFQ